VGLDFGLMLKMSKKNDKSDQDKEGYRDEDKNLMRQR
jgi:hypothetical protein